MSTRLPFDGVSPAAGFLHQLASTLRLHFRNPVALLYSYLFPTIFLVAFWVLYRHDRVPLSRHLGELLTITILGGACFGLPTTMVSERERGVWRRYRLAPVPSATLVASSVVARYFLLIVAGVLQLGLAMAIGMPAPHHPLDLWVAFTCVALAFLGMGLVIAMLADTVPAVQALGQCLFLPMLILGGVAVPLASLPSWAQHVAAFFPGRYAVDAIQVCVTGEGLGAARFSVLALLTIGVAGCVAGAGLFRWDAQQRFATRRGKGWVTVALAGWAAVGLMAELRGRTATRATAGNPPAQNAPAAVGPPSFPVSTPQLTDAEKTAKPRPAPATPIAGPQAPPATEPARPKAPAPAPDKPPARAAALPASWQSVTMEHIERDLRFDRLPSDAGVVSPIARADEAPDEDVATQLDFIAAGLIDWKPAAVADPVQRVRNLLYVAAVPDVFQMDPLERFVPVVVFDRLQQDVPADNLIKILYWIALHPNEGEEWAVDQLRVLKLGNGPEDMAQTRERAALYAVKLLGRLIGKIKLNP